MPNIEQLFNTPITRRGFLGGLATLGAGTALATGARGAEAQLATPEATAAMTEKLKGAAEKLFSKDDIALRISNAYQGEDDGIWCIAYQGAVVQDHPTLGVVLWNSMDELNQRDLDPVLDTLYQVPLQQSFTDRSTNTDEIFRVRADQLRLDKDIVDWAQKKRQSFEIGVPTSRQIPYGPFDVVRFQRYVAQRWADGRIERMLVGDIVKNVGRTIEGKTIPGKKIIPDIALLKEPEERLSQGGGATGGETLQDLQPVELGRPTQVVGDLKRGIMAQSMGSSLKLDINDYDTVAQAGIKYLLPAGRGLQIVLYDKPQDINPKFNATRGLLSALRYGCYGSRLTEPFPFYSGQIDTGSTVAVAVATELPLNKPFNTMADSTGPARTTTAQEVFSNFISSQVDGRINFLSPNKPEVLIVQEYCQAMHTPEQIEIVSKSLFQVSAK